MNRYHRPVSQSEVLARIQAMPFAEKRQFRIDWEIMKPGYPFREWLHQRTERLLHEEAGKHNASYY